MKSCKKNNLSILTKNRICIFIFSCLVMSCENDTHFLKINKYPTGELLTKTSYSLKDSLIDGAYKEYFKNGQIKKIIYFKNGIPIDSAMQFFETGELEFKEMKKLDTIHTYHYFKTGEVSLYKKFLNTDPTIEIDWSVFYDMKGDISDSIQHIRFKGSSYMNQRINYFKNEINIDSSNYYRFTLNKIENTDRFYLKITYEPFIKKAHVFFILGKQLNSDFSNIREVELDTIFMKNNTITTSVLTDSSKTFKGFFYEYLVINENVVDNDSIKDMIRNRKTFFDIKVMATKK